MKTSKAAALMVKHGLIQAAAVEDSESYDAGQTLANVEAFMRELGTDLDALAFERDTAQVELAREKKAMAWTLGKLRIADLFGSANDTGPAAAPDWLPGLYGAPEVAADCHRLDWINTHGRIGALNSRDVFLVLPGPRLDGEVPDVYNIRHVLDLCRENHQ